MPPIRFTAPFPFKVSCLNCRAAKRKCHSIDNSARCTRCTAQDLECEYKTHHRGRKPANARKSSTIRNHTTTHTTSTSSSPLYTPQNQQQDQTSCTLRQSAPSINNDNTRGIRFSHVVPIVGDSWPYIQRDRQIDADSKLSQTRQQSFEDSREHAVVERLLASHCLDPVQACILSAKEAAELFETYYSTLNLLVPILDPELCTTDTCQRECPLLFTAVLTITSKVLHPKAYKSCLLLANRLIGQTVEQGQCSISIVQAILLLVHFKEPDDTTGWRRIGYAIRMALELRINISRQGKANEGDIDARKRLNGQRTWLNLLISDYHMAIHHSLPRMITDDGIEDVDEWLKGHTHLQVRGENILPALIKFSRMCRLYADLIEGMNGDPSNLKLLSWVEREWKQWRRRYSIVGTQNNGESGFEQLQTATLLLCDSLFHFHTAEYKLLFRVRFRDESATGIPDSTELSNAFSYCVEAAMGPATVFLRDYEAHGLLPYASNIFWVALAVTGVWLIRNLGLMDSSHRHQVHVLLHAVQQACQDASRTPADPPAYMFRLLQHLLNRQDELHSSTMNDLISIANMRPREESARQLIQEGLWSRRPSMSGTHGQSTNIAERPATDSTPSSGLAFDDENNDMLFPSMDDEFWRLVFPIAEVA